MARPQRDGFFSGEFSKRLQIAMDNNPNCPPKYHGERTWLIEQLGKHGVTVGRETIRKWVEGEALPTSDKLPRIAEVLNVDPQWLMFGDTLPPKEASRHSYDAAALTNLVAGLISLNGGNIAFPARGLADANPNVHLHAAIRGANYPLHIVAGEVDGENLTFRVPAARRGIIVLGVVRRAWATFEVFELDEETITQNGEYARGQTVVSARPGSLRQITTFTERLWADRTGGP